MKITGRYSGINITKLIFIVLVISEVVDSYIIISNRTRIRRQNCGFKCTSGECVHEDEECDGITHCKDGSDETNACSRISCPAFTFKCSYGACIDASFECNGKTDCKDNSDETSPTCKRGCGPNQFQCKSGLCIHEDNKCDGTVECSDQSDESTETCSGLVCPGFTYVCAYGACVNGNSRCNGVKECFDASDEDPRFCPEVKEPAPKTPPAITPRPHPPIGAVGKCVLPAYPLFGKWVVSGEGRGLQPGDLVNPYTILTTLCRKNFTLEGSTYSHCTDQGLWSNEQGVCLPMCSPCKNTTFTKVTCFWNNIITDCETPTTGTVAKFWCIEHYEDLSLTQNPYRECSDGSWDYPAPTCYPVCGIKSINVEPLIIGGTPVRKGDYPWQVALYQTINNKKNLICGGALINERMALTAAHCISDLSTGEIKPANLFSIAVGKYYRKYGDSRDDKAQFSPLKSMHIPERYKGDDLYFQADIAVLVAEKPFHLSKWVQPVCVDRTVDRHNDTLQIQNNRGFVTGWGIKETSSPSEELISIEVPSVAVNECKHEMPIDFEMYLTYDKICAGFVNQSKGVCKGDSGGGLVFKNYYNGRYYIQGIVSVSTPAEKTDIFGCNSQSYALYTKVSSYIDFIFSIEKNHVNNFKN